ncbi:MAG: hypothetical protein WD359_03805 [Dehalococcoidia bacterium]
MATNDSKTVLAQDLSEAIDDLQIALTRAADAATRIQSLMPRVSAVNALLDEIESVIQSGRQGIGARGAPAESITRPTLVPNVESLSAPSDAATDSGWGAQEAETQQPTPNAAGDLICFRLEFQSSGGPLDLRAVDDAVGEHPAVRDVALLDYDGRNATLKVWVIAGTSPADIQQALSDRAAQIFGDSDVTIVALEDAA